MQGRNNSKQGLTCLATTWTQQIFKFYKTGQNFHSTLTTRRICFQGRKTFRPLLLNMPGKEWICRAEAECNGISMRCKQNSHYQQIWQFFGSALTSDFLSYSFSTIKWLLTLLLLGSVFFSSLKSPYFELRLTLIILPLYVLFNGFF